MSFIKKGLDRIYGSFNPAKAAQDAAITPIVEAYTYAVQLAAIPEKEDEFINQTADVARGMIAFLEVGQKTHNFYLFVSYRRCYEKLGWLITRAKMVEENKEYNMDKKEELLSGINMSITTIRSRMVTNAQIVLAHTYEKMKPIIPVLNKPYWMQQPGMGGPPQPYNSRIPMGNPQPSQEVRQ